MPPKQDDDDNDSRSPASSPLPHPTSMSFLKDNLRGQDVVLFIAIAASMTVGILLPSFGIIFEPYLLVWLGILLFLNLIRLDVHDLSRTFKKPQRLAVLSIAKLVLIPLAAYAVAKVVYEPLAVPVLLLSGVSTGLGAPFVINAVEKSKRLPLVVAMVIVTSLAVPFTLPSLTYLLLDGEGSEFEIPIADMVFLLAVALFTPIMAGWFTKRQWPSFAKRMDKKSFPASIVLVSLINLGIFANISDLFFKEPDFLAVNIVASFILFAAYGATGFLVGGMRARTKNNRIISSSGNNDDNNNDTTTTIDASTAASEDSSKRRRRRDLGIVGLITISYVNNVLVFVFASQFFGIDVAALAAFYNLPYYGLILLLKVIVKQES